jgi:hypothetical protein
MSHEVQAKGLALVMPCLQELFQSVSRQNGTFDLSADGSVAYRDERACLCCTEKRTRTLQASPLQHTMTRSVVPCHRHISMPSDTV